MNSRGQSAGPKEPREMAPGIFVVSGYAPYNLGAIAVDGGVVAVDVPPTPAEAKQWQAWIEAHMGPLRYVILTDARPERLVGAALWKAPLVALGPLNRKLAGLDDRSWNEVVAGVGRQFPGTEYGKLKPRRAMISAESRLGLHGRPGGIELWTVSGAAMGSIFVSVPEEGALFSGDTVILGEPPLVDATPDWSAWLQTLKTISNQRGLRWLAPGRGLLSVRPAEVEAMLEFFHVSRSVARSLARSRNRAAELGRAAQDLTESFFSGTTGRSEAQRRVRLVLEIWVTELEK